MLSLKDCIPNEYVLFRKKKKKTTLLITRVLLMELDF